MKQFICLFIALAAALTCPVIVSGQTHPAEQQTFAIIYSPGPNWIKGKSIFEQNLFEHGQYMSRLLKQGHLQLGGPFSDSSGGLVILTAKDKDEADQILKNDPSITTGVFQATVRPWEIVFRKS